MSDLDTRLKDAGMIPVAELLQGQPLDKFLAHNGVRDLPAFQEWLEKKCETFTRMRMEYEIGDRDKSDDLYEWVFAHAATFHEVAINLRQALTGTTDKRPT